MSASLPPLQPHATRDLAAFASGLTFADIPAAVVGRAKLCLLDGIGVCLQGATLPWTRIVQDMVATEGARGAASVFARGLRTSWANAVLANSTAGHAYEMDDIHTESVLHPNSLTVPIVLGFAEGAAAGTVSGRDLLTAMVAGTEIGTRIGNAATTQLFLNGFHPQGTGGTFVAAGTAGRLKGLDAARMQDALGIAGSMAAGLMAAQEGAMVKRLHAGRAAQSGVYAAELAARGFTGISDIVEAAYGGFLSSFARTPNPARLSEGLGEQWEALRVGFKLYPNVTSIHTSLDALRHLMAEHRLSADDIAAVEVGCGHMTYVHTAWEYRAAGATAAQMNMAYGLAAMATSRDGKGGEVTADDYGEARMADPALTGFMAKVAIHEDAELEAMGHRFRHACRMRVTTADGRVLSHEILHRRGSPDGGIDEGAVVAKFQANVRGLLDRADADRLVDLALSLDAVPDAAELCTLVAERVRVAA